MSSHSFVSTSNAFSLAPSRDSRDSRLSRQSRDSRDVSRDRSDRRLSLSSVFHSHFHLGSLSASAAHSTIDPSAGTSSKHKFNTVRASSSDKPIIKALQKTRSLSDPWSWSKENASDANGGNGGKVTNNGGLLGRVRSKVGGKLVPPSSYKPPNIVTEPLDSSSTAYPSIESSFLPSSSKKNSLIGSGIVRPASECSMSASVTLSVPMSASRSASSISPSPTSSSIIPSMDQYRITPTSPSFSFNISSSVHSITTSPSSPNSASHLSPSPPNSNRFSVQSSHSMISSGSNSGRSGHSLLWDPPQEATISTAIRRPLTPLVPLQSSPSSGDSGKAQKLLGHSAPMTGGGPLGRTLTSEDWLPQRLRNVNVDNATPRSPPPNSPSFSDLHESLTLKQQNKTPIALAERPKGFWKRTRGGSVGQLSFLTSASSPPTSPLPPTFNSHVTPTALSKSRGWSSASSFGSVIGQENNGGKNKMKRLFGSKDGIFSKRRSHTLESRLRDPKSPAREEEELEIVDYPDLTAESLGTRSISSYDSSDVQPASPDATVRLGTPGAKTIHHERIASVDVLKEAMYLRGEVRLEDVCIVQPPRRAQSPPIENGLSVPPRKKRVATDRGPFRPSLANGVTESRTVIPTEKWRDISITINQMKGVETRVPKGGKGEHVPELKPSDSGIAGMDEDIEFGKKIFKGSLTDAEGSSIDDFDRTLPRFPRRDGGNIGLGIQLTPPPKRRMNADRRGPTEIHNSNPDLPRSLTPTMRKPGHSDDTEDDVDIDGYSMVERDDESEDTASEISSEYDFGNNHWGENGLAMGGRWWDGRTRRTQHSNLNSNSHAMTRRDEVEVLQR